MIIRKPLLLTSLALLVLSTQPLLAQGAVPYGYGYNPYSSPYRNQYYNRNPYQNYNQYYNRNPYQNYNQYYNRNYNRPTNFFNNRSFNNRPFNNGYSNNRYSNNRYRGRRNNGFGEEFWPGRDSIYENILPVQGPWSRNWGEAPWNRDYDNLWGSKGGPSAWFDPSDPKEGIAQAWEDMLVTPNELGTMPGGWKAPSISVPNPIDVGDEFKNAAKDMPGEMQDFSEGFTYGEDGYNDGPSAPQGKKDKGISIDTSRKGR